MKNEQEELLNDVLSQWWSWKPTSIDIGFYTVNAASRQYRCSRQYDDTNSALDSDLHNTRMQAVDDCIYRLEQPYLLCVEMNARNLCTGLAVWTSARLPADSIERAHLVMHARAKLLILLESAGIT